MTIILEFDQNYQAMRAMKAEELCQTINDITKDINEMLKDGDSDVVALRYRIQSYIEENNVKTVL